MSEKDILNYLKIKEICVHCTAALCREPCMEENRKKLRKDHWVFASGHNLKFSNPYFFATCKHLIFQT